jgi:hypothetical protein
MEKSFKYRVCFRLNGVSQEKYFTENQYEASIEFHTEVKELCGVSFHDTGTFILDVGEIKE